MGSILKANCDKCGFEKEVWFGAGMKDFTTICNVPAITKKTGRLGVKNILKEHMGDYTFYSDPTMYEGELGDDAHQWGEVMLKRENNLCPRCKNFTMVFEDNGCFD